MSPVKKSNHHPHAVILGAGEIGRAINHLLAPAAERPGVHVQLWDRDPSQAPCARPLEAVVPEADFLFLCIPSWAIRGLIATIRPLLRRDTVVISLSKGLEKKTLATVDRVLKESLPRGQRFAMLAGPMLAEEIMQDLGAAAVAVSASRAARESVRDLFAGTTLRIEVSSDVRGVALAGVVKNVYAVALGVADGLGWGGNRKGWLTARAAAEMRTVLSGLGADPQTVTSAAGIADLVATGFSRYSRNHQVGDELVHARKLTVRSEGIVALPSLLKIVGARKRHFPMLLAIESVALRRRDPKKTFERFFREA